MSKKSNALAAQQAEWQRQADLETQRASESAAAQQAQWQEMLAQQEARIQSQLQQQQEEAQRQRDQEAQTVAEQMAQRKAELDFQKEKQAAEQARAAERARLTREYATGRQKAMDTSRTAIDTAYAGFNDDYFKKFAQDFVNYYKPKLDRQTTEANRGATFAYSDSGNLRSTAAARAFGDISRQSAEKSGEIANGAVDASKGFQQDIEGQKGEALDLLNSSAAVGNPNLPDDIDQAGFDSLMSGIGSQLGALTQTQVNKARAIKTPSYGAANLNMGFTARLPGGRTL